MTRLLSILTLFALMACSHHGHDENAVSSQIKEREKDYKGVSVTSEDFTVGVKTHPVVINGNEFLIRDQESKLKHFPCADCHTKPLAELKSEGEQKSHWDITLNHASGEVMDCLTCHSANNMNHLHTNTEQPVRFNDSYMLCGQCHAPQYKDWQGGAHGKRLGGWAPPRTANNCTDCHNPHDPGFKHRWPSRFNTQKVEERK